MMRRKCWRDLRLRRLMVRSLYCADRRQSTKEALERVIKDDFPHDPITISTFRRTYATPGAPMRDGIAGTGITDGPLEHRDCRDRCSCGTEDWRLVRCIEGSGKFAGSLGAMVAEGPTGVENEIGSFQLTNEQQRWIWEHRQVLTGQVAEVRAMNVNASGAIRAGVLVRFHPSRSEAGLLMYSESLAGGDPAESRSTLYKLKSAAGWSTKV